MYINDSIEYPFKLDTEKIIGLAFEIHNNLGFGFLEVTYKEAFEYLFNFNGIEYVREKAYSVKYKQKTLPHKFYADFVVDNKIILEIKAKKSLPPEDIAQAINYLKCSGCKVGLILNFGTPKVEIKRVIL